MLRKKLLAILLVTVAVSAVWPASAQAQHRRGGRQVVFVRGFYDPFFYDPWFGPWGPWYPSPYAYGYYPRFAGPEADVRVLVKPNKAEVYVDGYYAGIVDDFDGLFQRLRLPPGEHEITLRLDGYKTVHQKLYLQPNSTYKLRYTMQPLGPGETTEPPPSPPTPPPASAAAPPSRMPPQGMPRRMPPPGYPPQAYPQPPPQYPQTAPGETASSSTIAIRVQPSGADVTIDGERWQGPEGEERLLVQVSEGPHRVEIQKNGYRRFTTEIQVRRGETVPLNVSLTPERQ